MVFYGPVATLYRQAAGLGIFHITLIESISLALTIFLEIPWGALADRIGYRKTMVSCCVLFFVSKIIFWQADGFSGFLLERLLLSVVCAGLSGVDSSMLYLSSAGEDSHRVFSIHENLGQLGLLLAACIYGLWVGENYRLAAFLTVLSYGAAAVLSLCLREVIRTPKESSSVTGNLLTVLKKQLTDPRILLLLLAVGLLNESHQTITVFLSQLQYAKAGMSHEAMSLAYVLTSLAGLAGGFSAAVCVRMGAKRMGTSLFILGSVSCLLLFFSSKPLICVTAVILLRLSFSLLQPLHVELQNRQIIGRDRATALSVNAVVMESIGILLNLIYGRIAEENLAHAMFLGSALCGLGIILYRRSCHFR
jgi:predicted MFS family arabinose efflux permease